MWMLCGRFRNGASELNRPGLLVLALSLWAGVESGAATAPSVEDFASRQKIEDVSISPDGRHLALIQTSGGRAAAVVIDRRAGEPRVQRVVLAEPERVCIVGWSFGGYLALLGAQRNPDLFRCAVDIAGISDLGLLIDEGHYWLTSESIKKQIGTDADNLKRNSPRLHAAEFMVPLLMVHGQMDAQVPLAQSAQMDAALKHAGKPHRLVVLPDADHQFGNEKDRTMLLNQIEAFLREHLSATATN